ncbi:hypothetical protein ACFQO1_12605 [Jejudonia soesokkakensis]|uniref:Uncharacterized protein n=1 Tax=Jejudonia soesokkakensis TaxID=1323432 RepID=A0ABW2MYE0_9FLAO
MMVFFNKRFFIILLIIMTLLLLPLIAGYFSKQINWSLSDYVIAGGLFIFAGGCIELILSRAIKPKHKYLGILIIITILLLVFIELAVGLFGTPFAGS